MNRKQKKMLARILTAAAMLIALKLIPVTGVLQLALYLVAYLVIGYDILKKAWRGILNRQVFDENFLMAVATVGAFALAIISRSGDYVEAIAVMLFYQVGELFQSYAVGRSRRSISQLMDIRPDYANIEKDGALVQVDPVEVSIGQTIVIKAGERIPLDGFDMAALEVTLCGGTPPPPNGGPPRTERSPLPCGHLPTPWGATLFKGGLFL